MLEKFKVILLLKNFSIF